MKNNDTQLIHRILDGDDAAFAELVEKYQKQVHALVWRKIGDFHIAEEITQDTFLKAYQKLGELKKPQRFASWLYVIATNRCSTWLRKKHLRKQLLADKDVTQSEKATYSEYVLEENERITAETQRDVVKKLLAKLGESERTVMTLHYFGEMSHTEIGAFLGVSANTVKSRLRRAQQRLQKEETMIREALDHFQISPNLTETIMRELSRAKPAAPSSGKPVVPWAVAASTLVVVLLMLGFGNHRYLERFQKPYSLDVTAEMTVEIVDAPIVANLESKPDVRTQIGSANALDKQNKPDQQPNNVAAAVAEAQVEKIAEDYTKWELPKEAKARFGKGGIDTMQFSPDGTLLAVGSSIGVWLYDVKTGKEVSMFPGMGQSIAFSPDGRLLASGGIWRLELWEISTGRKVTPPDVLFGTALLHFSQDGKTLVSFNRVRRTISKLDIETGKSTGTNIELHSSFSNPEPYALTQDRFAIGRDNGKIELWDVSTGSKITDLSGHSAQVPMQIWEEQNQDILDGINQGEIDIQFLPAAGNDISALAFSSDGAKLASGSMNTTVRLWDTTRNDGPVTLQKHTGWVNALAFSPDGQMLASGSTDKTVLLWDTATGELLATLLGHINGIAALTFSPDGTTLVSASTDGTVLFWNTKTRKQLPTRITGHTKLIKSVAFLKDSTTLASVGFNGAITFWDMKTSQKTFLQTATYQDMLSALAFSPDGTKLVSVGAKGNVLFEAGLGSVSSNFRSDQSIRLTDVRTGRQLGILPEEGGCSSAAFSPDGKTVAFNDYGRIRVWNTETGAFLDIPLFDKAKLAQNGGLELPPGIELPPGLDLRSPKIAALVFSPDGKKLVGGTMGGKVQMWDPETGAVLAPLLAGQDIDDEIKKDVIKEEKPNSFSVKIKVGSVNYNDPITVLAFSSNGDLLAVGSERKIRMLGSKEQIGFEEAHHGAKSLLFSPDDTLLVSGLISGKIELWDLATGAKLTTLEGHTAPVETLVFSPDGKTLVSTGQDGTILLWDWDEVIKSSDR